MTTLNTNSMNTTISFRTKFSKLLNDETRPIVLQAFKHFCNIDAQTTTARDILWDLTYSETSSLEALKLLGLNQELFAVENILKLRSELRYQYEKLHKDYFTSYIPEECISAFNNMAQKTDTIVASVIYDASMYYIQFGDIDRTLFLLSNDKENFFFGGIRELGFSSTEAEYLKPYHMSIHDFLKFLNDLHTSTKASLDENSSELPFNYEEVGTTAEEVINDTSEFRRVIAENVVMHRDIFTIFSHSGDLNVLPTIANLGFNLNEVMSKKEKIHNYIVAIEEKEKAEAKLLEAHMNLNL